MVINNRLRGAIRGVIDALFERAKARLLGRFSNRIYFHIVHDFGFTDTLEGASKYAASLSHGVGFNPSEEILLAHADETSSLMDALKNKTLNDVFNAVKTGDDDLIREVIEKATQRVEMVVSEELNRAQSVSVVEGIDKVSQSQNLDDPTLIWYGVNDESTCKWCKKMYRSKNNPRKPRAWKRSQLSMAYFKPKEWDESTVHINAHPRCRDRMTVVMPGFGLDEAGHIKYMGRDYDEYEAQKQSGDT